MTSKIPLGSGTRTRLNYPESIRMRVSGPGKASGFRQPLFALLFLGPCLVWLLDHSYWREELGS